MTTDSNSGGFAPRFKGDKKGPNTKTTADDNKTQGVKIEYIKRDALKPHPKNKIIYGTEDVSDLVDLIKEAGGRIVERLIVTPDYTIISGHRRWMAAEKLEIEELPCEIKTFESEEDQLEELVLRNAKRTKTTAQKVREGMTLQDVYSSEATQRRLANLKQNRAEADDSSESGSTRDKIAEAIGFRSGKTYDRGKNVIAKVDELLATGKSEDAELLIAILNKSASAAEDLLKLNLDDLSEEVKQNLKAGKIAPRSLVPKELKAANAPTPYTAANKETAAISRAVRNLRKIALDKVSNKQKVTIQGNIQARIEELQKLISIFETQEQ